MSEHLDPKIIRFLEEMAVQDEGMDWQMQLFEEPDLPFEEQCPNQDCGLLVNPIQIYEGEGCVHCLK
jgi:hypothetical protein